MDSLRFRAPFGGLGSMYTSGKHIVDFLLVLIELFAGCYS